MDFRTMEMQFVAKEMNSETQEIKIDNIVIGFKNVKISFASKEMKIGEKIMHIAIQEIKLSGIATRPNNTETKGGALFFCFLSLYPTHKCDGKG